MYNNDLYNVIIAESRHIQDAIMNSSGGGGSDPGLISNVAAITSDVDDINTCVTHLYINRSIVTPFDPTSVEEGFVSITDAFQIPSDGLQERLYYCSLYVAKLQDGNYVIDLNGSFKVYVETTDSKMFQINDEQATFSSSLPLSRNTLSKMKIPTGQQYNGKIIMGVFSYSTK